MLTRLLLFTTLFITSHTAFTQDFFDIVEVEETAEEVPDSALKIRGHVQQDIKYGLHQPDSDFAFERNKRGLSQVRSEIFLEAKYIFSPALSAQISGKSEIDWMQWQQGNQDWKPEKYDNRLKDAFIDYTFADTWWLRAGKQVFAWGESESLSITDILSTQDLREPGQAELEDIRESVAALSLSKSINRPSLLSTLNFVLTYKAGTDLYAEAHEDFYPNISLKPLLSNEQIHFSEPRKEWEAALRYSLNAAGGDYSLVLGEINSNTPEAWLANGLDDGIPDELFFLQRRQRVYGLSANKALREFILRSEYAYYDDKDFSQIGNLPLFRQQQQRFMAGAEYAGFNNWILSFEYNVLKTEIKEHSAESDSDTGFTLRIQNNAFNEKLTSQLWLIKLSEFGGEVARLSLSYKPVDNWEFLAAYILYANDKPDSTLYPFRKNDTLNLAFKYGF